MLDERVLSLNPMKYRELLGCPPYVISPNFTGRPDFPNERNTQLYTYVLVKHIEYTTRAIYFIVNAQFLAKISQ